MIIAILSTLVFASGGADIVAERVIAAPTSTVYDEVFDLHKMEQLFAGACIVDWQHGAKSVGLGATAMITYQAGAMKRELLATVSRSEEDWIIDVNHPGKNGFLTRWLFETVDNGTRVTLTTYLNEPHWLFRRYFYKRVHRDWVGCYSYALERLAQQVER
jgi:hypothetical protein